MKRGIVAILVLALTMLPLQNGLLVQPAEAAMSGEVKIAGSSTVYPISTALAEEYRRMHPNVRIPVSSTGTGGGFANFFCEGKTDVNDASRPIKDSELRQCNSNGVQPVEFRVATDALTVVINPNNTWAENMTVEQLREIWKPNGAEKWSDVDPSWPDKNIEAYGAASTSGTFDYLTEVVVGEEDSHRKDYQATEHDNTIVQAVSGSKYAMGYFGFAYYSQNKDKVKAVAVDSGNGPVKPTLQTAQAGEYKPLARPLFIYVSRSSLRNKPQVRDFVQYYIKQSTREIIAQVGYVPVNRDTMLQNLGKLTVMSE